MIAPTDRKKNAAHEMFEIPASRIEYPSFGGQGSGPGLSVPVVLNPPRARVHVSGSTPLGSPDLLTYEYVVPDLHVFARAEYPNAPPGFENFRTATVEILLMMTVPTIGSAIDYARAVAKRNVHFITGASLSAGDSGSMGVHLPRTTDGEDTLWALVICAKTAWSGAASSQPKPLIVGICPIPVSGRLDTRVHNAPA